MSAVCTPRDPGISIGQLGGGDAAALAELANDIGIARSVSEPGTFPHPYKRENAMAFIEYAAQASISGIEFPFGVFLDGRLIGSCSIREPNYGKKECQIGYWIGRDYQNKGYGKEAVLLLLDFAFRVLGMKRVSAETFAANRNSIALLRSVGFSPNGSGNLTSDAASRGQSAKFLLTRGGYMKRRGKQEIRIN